MASSRKDGERTSAIHHAVSVTNVICDFREFLTRRTIWRVTTANPGVQEPEKHHVPGSLLRIPNMNRKSTTRERRVLRIARYGGPSILRAGQGAARVRIS
jgi:hypothetical protein